MLKKMGYVPKNATLAKDIIANSDKIAIYRSSNGPELKVRLEKDNIWLTQAQISMLFGTKRPAITKHLGKIFGSGELNEKAVCSILERTAADGKDYKTQFYSLDAIISVGYRVNSKKATQFRIWATKTLKDHIVKGFTVNERRLLGAENKLRELQDTISFLQEKTGHKQLNGREAEILSLISSYSMTLTLLDQYDNGSLALKKTGRTGFIFKYDEAKKVICELKNDLSARNEASDLFGNEVENKLKSVFGALYQTFDGKELYRSIEEKAAHLLYFVIKDHPFTDGNKRTASFLFVYYLDRNRYLHKQNGEKRINDSTLVTLALLVAISEPREKDKMIKIISNLISV